MFNTKQVRGNTITYPVFIAGAIFALLALVNTVNKPPALTNINLVPNTTVVNNGGVFTTDVVVSSETSVNVFAGTITFDPAFSSVEDIRYNTSIADLWTDEPWYENGDGTITFAGGTTQPGGFVGAGQLMTITFRTKDMWGTKIVFAKYKNFRA